MIDRRAFMAQSGALALLGGTAPALAKPRALRPGIQLWTVAKMLSVDFEGTIALLAKMGFREIETFGPYAFSDPRQIESWKAITPSLGFSGSGFFGQSTKSAGAIFRRHGFKVPSLHTDLFTLQTRMPELAEAARALGAKYVTLPSLPAELRKSLDDYRRAADLFNAIGKAALRSGVRFAYHNHGYGFTLIDGKVPLDLLIEATDPAQVFFELDTYWTAAGGADPKEYLRRYKSRYRMMHLKDMKGAHRFSGDGGGPQEWISLFPHMTPLGTGSMDIKGIVAEARKSGVEHFFVEQDYAVDKLAAIKASAGYLRKIGFR